jgi:vacuolar-type H+-ATPase subunit I/STV1
MTDIDIVKALECCNKPVGKNSCEDCPFHHSQGRCTENMLTNALDLLNRQQAEIENLEYKLLGVMHFVDKWLNGAELEQDEINRAVVMREKTLQIVEKQQAEIERLKEKYDRTMTSLKAVLDERADHTEAIKEFAEKVKAKCDYMNDYYGLDYGWAIDRIYEEVDDIVKEMVGEDK